MKSTRKHRKALRAELLRYKVEELLYRNALVTDDLQHILTPTYIIYPDVTIIHESNDPFTVFERYARVFGQALPLWQMIDQSRYFGHIGYHMHFARKRFSRKVVDRQGNPVVRNLQYQPCLPYKIDVWYPRTTAKITQYFLTDLMTNDKLFGPVPLVLAVGVETTARVLGINVQPVRNKRGVIERLVSDPPQHELLEDADWKIWGQNGRWDGNLHRFEYEGRIYESPNLK